LHLQKLILKNRVKPLIKEKIKRHEENSEEKELKNKKERSEGKWSVGIK
jgi:hypothetical protein